MQQTHKNYFLIIWVILVLILCGIFAGRFFTGTDYSTRGAVTYFGDSGRYQLHNPVAEDYALYDAKEEKFISGFVNYYTQSEDKVYMVTNPSRIQTAYAVLDLENETFTEEADITAFDADTQAILSDTEAMVDLTKERSSALKNILKFIPQKWRKW